MQGGGLRPLARQKSGMEYPDLDGCRINPSNCPEYISCEDYDEQEEFYE